MGAFLLVFTALCGAAVILRKKTRIAAPVCALARNDGEKGRGGDV